MKHMNRLSLIFHIFTLCLLVLCVSCKFLHNELCQDEGVTNFKSEFKESNDDNYLRTHFQFLENRHLLMDPVRFPRTNWDFRVDCDDNCLRDGTRWHKDTCQLQLTSNEYLTNQNGECDTDPTIIHRVKLPSYIWSDYMSSEYEFEPYEELCPYLDAVCSYLGNYWDKIRCYQKYSSTCLKGYPLTYSWQRPPEHEVYDVYMFYKVDTPETLYLISNPRGLLAILLLDKYGGMDKYQRDLNSGSIKFTKWFFIPDRIVRDSTTGNLVSTITMSYIKDVQIPGVRQAYGLTQEPQILNALNCTQDNNGCLELYNQFRRQDMTSPGCYCLNVVWNEFILCDHLDKTYYTHTLASSSSCDSWITFLRGHDADHAVRFFNQLEGVVGGIDITIPKECIYESNLIDYANVDEDIVFDIPYSNKIDILKPWKKTLPHGYSAWCLRINLKQVQDKIFQCTKHNREYFVEYEKEELSTEDFDYAAFRYYDNTGKVLPAKIHGRFKATSNDAVLNSLQEGDDWTDDSYTCKPGYFEEFNTVQYSYYCAQNPQCNQTSMDRYDVCNENNWKLEYGGFQYLKEQAYCEPITHYQHLDDNGKLDCLHRSVESEQGFYFNGQIDSNSELVRSACTTCVSGEPDYTVRPCSNVLDARCKCPDNQIFGRLSLPEGIELSDSQRYMTGHNTSECIPCNTCDPLEGFYEEKSCEIEVLYWNGDVSEETQISNDYLVAGAGYYTVVQDTQCGTCNKTCASGKYQDCSANNDCEECSCDFGDLGKEEAYCYVNTTVCDGTGFQNAGAEVKRFDDIVCEAGFYKNLDSLLGTVGSGEYYKYVDTTDRTREIICQECELQSTITFEGVYGKYKFCKGTIKEDFKMLNDYFYNKSLACTGTSYELEDQAGCQPCDSIPQYASFIEILKCNNQDCSGANVLLRNDVDSCAHECQDRYYQDEDGQCKSCDEPCSPGQYRPVTECTNNIQKLPDCESCKQVKCSLGQYIFECVGGDEDNSCEDCSELTCDADQVLQECPGTEKSDTSQCVDCGAENTNTLQIPANATALTSAGGDACGFQCNAGFYREANECFLCPTDVLQERCCLDWVAENEGENIEICPYALLLDTCDIPGVQHGRPGCVCKAGNFLSRNKCTACGANKFTETDFNHNTCKSCKKGKYSIAGSSSCTPCPVNKYRENIGVNQCRVCEAGTSNQTGQYNCETGCYPGEKARAKVELGYWVFNTGTSVCDNVFELPSSCLINGTLYCETLEEMRWGDTQERCESSSAFEYSSQEPTYTTECVPCESGYAWSGNFNPFDDSATDDTSSNGEGISQDSDAPSGSSDTCIGFFCN